MRERAFVPEPRLGARRPSNREWPGAGCPTMPRVIGRLADRLHPGRSLTARIGLVIGAAALVLSIVLGLAVARASLADSEREPTDRLAAPTPDVLVTGLALGLPLGLLLAVGGWMVVASQLRPLAAIAVVAERMRRGDRSAAIPAGGDDELGRLAGSLGGLQAALALREAERQRTEEQLYRHAYHDPLTDLPNRALFMDRLGLAMRRRPRGAGPRFAVLMLDLDRFKLVNDSLGHEAGDTLLVQLARRLEVGLRPVDTVARLGGDEFVILLDDLEDVADVPLVAERILEELRRPFDLGGHEVFAGASIGIAYGDLRYDRPEDVLRDADTASYRAKAGGKGRYVTFDARMHERGVRLLALETDLRRSLEREQLFLDYLPIVALEDGRIVGAEALLRWRHPTLGVLPAAEFIPLAEETGLIVPIGEWLLGAACAQACRWHSAGLPLRLSVNLSARQLRQADLASVLRQALADTGLDPRMLDLELTEAAVMAHAAEIAEQLAALCELGVRISVDDFGTAYSSLNHLRRLPVHALKIDASLVRDVATDHDDETIVAALISLAHNLNLKVVAEGVETVPQLACLREHGCDEIQGSVFSPPLSSAALEALVSSGRRLAATYSPPW